MSTSMSQSRDRTGSAIYNCFPGFSEPQKMQKSKDFQHQNDMKMFKCSGWVLFHS